MKKFYITTSIAYTNAPPHIGFALELMQADSVARYNRSLGRDVWFLTGTDEHGSKIARKAKEMDKDPQEFCDDIVADFKALTDDLNISNDDFIRTTDKEKHWPGVIKLWETMRDSGDIYEKEYEGLYCVGCEAFVKEKDLVEGKCPYHHKVPELVKEKNYFFRLSRYSDRITKALEDGTLDIVPSTRRNEVLSFVKKGLDDVSFSRPKDKVEWGIPVPGDESQSIYVWGDALTNYISAVGYGRNEAEFNDHWPADIHFIGKDISKFHALIWPGMLLSAGLPLPKRIFIHGFLTVNGQKMSKSLGNVVDPFELIRQYGADPVRYFFLREVTPTEDGDFSPEKFKERYNADLAGGLGNLAARTITLASKTGVSAPRRTDPTVIAEIERAKSGRDSMMDEFKFNTALEEIWRLIAFADRYVEVNRPWEKKAGREEIIGDLLFMLESIAQLIEPFMPDSSATILDQMKKGKSDPIFKRADL